MLYKGSEYSGIRFQGLSTFNSILRGIFPAFLKGAKPVGCRITIESYPWQRAALFIRASSTNLSLRKFGSSGSGTRMQVPKRAMHTLCSSPTIGFVILTRWGASSGLPYSSASLKLEARNFPRFWYALESCGGTCHQSFLLMCETSVTINSFLIRGTRFTPFDCTHSLAKNADYVSGNQRAA